ncbi:MAG: hypothetical protein AAF968_20975 [Pseudomonadota bacterium]
MPAIPVGTVISKESFKLGHDGTLRAGNLFFMEKEAEGTSP